jgi:hypothetical protein
MLRSMNILRLKTMGDDIYSIEGNLIIIRSYICRNKKLQKVHIQPK